MEILLAGCTDWWSDTIITSIFQKDHVTVLGRENRKRTSLIRSLDADFSDEQFRSLLSSTEFDAVIYCSENLAWHRHFVFDARQLQALLQMLDEHRRQIPVIVVTSNEILKENEESDSMCLHALENICSWYRRRGMDITVLRSPYLYSFSWQQDYWRQSFQKAIDTGKWQSEKAEDQKLNFIDARDLVDMIAKMLDKWEHEVILTLPYGTHTVSEMLDVIRKTAVNAEITAGTMQDVLQEDLFDKRAEEQYGWKLNYSVPEEYRKDCRDYLAKQEKSEKKRRRMRALFNPDKPLFLAVELALGALIVSLLNTVLMNTILFHMIDVRLLYIVLMASLYGIRPGLAAAALMVFSLARAYLQQGYEFSALFYNTENWLPFVFYFVVGGIMGYYHQRSADEKAMLQNQIDLLKKHNEFLTGLYDQTVSTRNEYRHNLIESRDGFGRIFDVVKKLDIVEPQELFNESINVIEDILDTKSAAIYVIPETDDSCAKLEACSKGMASKLTSTITLNPDYSEAFTTISSGGIWFNRAFLNDYPSYIAGISSDGSVHAMIMIYNVPFDQATTYYENLIRILAGLMQSSLFRALEYQQIKQNGRYVEDTLLLNSANMEKVLKQLHAHTGSGMGAYRVLHIVRNGRSNAELDAAVRLRLRSTDSLGIGKDGEVYLIAPGADDAAVNAMTKRFKEIGIEIELCRDEALI